MERARKKRKEVNEYGERNEDRVLKEGKEREREK